MKDRRSYGVDFYLVRRGILFFMVLMGIMTFGLLISVDLYAQEDSGQIIEDFQKTNEKGFPLGWEAQRSLETAQKTYVVSKEGDVAFLRANGASQRIYIKVEWDPREKPIVTWRWRAQSIPAEADLVAAVYVSLDTDLLVIPVSTKYIWSRTKAKGLVVAGGMFGATEMVLRSGDQPLGEWVEERVNAYEDFKEIHQHEPAPQAWGISLLGGPGIEVDFGSIAIHAN